MSEITITLVSWYSCKYIISLIDNLCEKASQPDLLRFLVIDNTNGVDTALQQLREIPHPIEIHSFSPGQLKSSRAHAAGLNTAMPLLKTRYTLVCDPDIYVFRQNWDTILKNRLQSTGAAAAGAPYPAWKTGKYHDFPSPPFCFFETETIQELCSDWYPFSATQVGIVWKFVVRQVGRMGLLISRHSYQKYRFLRRYSDWAEKTLGVFAPDTGWKIAQTAREKNVKSIVFDTIIPDDTTLNRHEPSGPLLKLAKHYELFFYQNKPFVVHKYGTRGLLWRTPRGNDDAYWKECILATETSRPKEQDI